MITKYKITKLFRFPRIYSSDFGFNLVQNHLFIKAEGEILYNYNHGHLAATDQKTVVVNFLNALNTMPALLEKHKADNEKLMKDTPKHENSLILCWAEANWKLPPISTRIKYCINGRCGFTTFFGFRRQIKRKQLPFQK